VRDYSTVRGIRIKYGEAARHVGGCVYVGLASVAGGGFERCKVHISSDTSINPRYDDGKLMHVGEAVLIKSSMGNFDLFLLLFYDAPTSRNKYCEFDLIRD
jgi:hypothetical protein